MNVLIVEDEKIERDALVSLFSEYFSKRVQLVTSVNNGESALEEFERNNFELVISDINIPRMNGLELLRAIKTRKPKTRCIILTSYDYFEYAQESIRIGVDDFILKPAKKQDICNRIEKMMDMIEEESKGEGISLSYHLRQVQSILQSDLLYAILYNDSEKNIQRYFKILHMNVKNAVCFCIKRKETDIDGLDKVVSILKESGYICIFETYFDNLVVFVFYDEIIPHQSVVFIYNMFIKLCANKSVIGVGKVKSKCSEFYDSFKEALGNINNSVGFQEEKSSVSVNEEMLKIIDEIEEAIKVGNENISTNISKKIYDQLLVYDRKDANTILENFFYTFMERMEKYDHALDKDNLQKELKRISQAQNIRDIYIQLTYLVKSMIDPIIYSTKKNTHHLIKEAYKYIEKKYRYPIGLNDVAAHLDVTPQYISSLFTKYTGKNFTYVLSEYRVNKAKELLDQGAKIKEIASLVGFQNQNYFTKVFKKITGVTPSEYKNE